MYSMKEACRMTNMSYENLKFYCNEGLVPNVKRDRNNYRVFSDNDIKWIQSLSCLKRCGMTIAEMKEYLELCLKGEASIPERKIILAKKREALLEAKKEIEASLAFIDWKENFYNEVLSGKTKYYSNLIST
jgi:MerR family transcriptional regulator, aldehyde-responsive regulator